MGRHTSLQAPCEMYLGSSQCVLFLVLLHQEWLHTASLPNTRLGSSGFFPNFLTPICCRTLSVGEWAWWLRPYIYYTAATHAIIPIYTFSHTQYIAIFSVCLVSSVVSLQVADSQVCFYLVGWLGWSLRYDHHTHSLITVPPGHHTLSHFIFQSPLTHFPLFFSFLFLFSMI